MSIGSSGTKLVFAKDKPTRLHYNKRIGCFDPYWSRVPHKALNKKNIYFTFDYLHCQTEELLKELNKIMKGVLIIELLDKEEKDAYHWKDSYGHNSTLGKPKIAPKSKRTYTTFKVLKGIYKITFDEWILANDKLRRTAQVLGYMMHHTLCAFSPSEHWLKIGEYNKIILSRYKVKDLIGFIIFLTNNRNKRTNRRLTTATTLTRKNLTSLGNIKKIRYISENSQIFPIGKQTLTLKTFNTTIKEMEGSISIVKQMKKTVEKSFGKPGEFSVLYYRKMNYSGGHTYEHHLVQIKEFKEYNNQILYELIADKLGAFLPNNNGRSTLLGICIHPSHLKKDKNGKVVYNVPTGSGANFRGVFRINKKLNKKEKEIIDKLFVTLETQQRNTKKALTTSKTRLNKAVKEFESCVPIKKVTSMKDQNKYQIYTKKRTTFFNARKSYDLQEFNLAIITYYIDKIWKHIKKEEVSE